MTTTRRGGAASCTACQDDDHVKCVYLATPPQEWRAHNLSCVCYTEERVWHELLLQRLFLKSLADNTATVTRDKGYGPTETYRSITSPAAHPISGHPAGDYAREPHDVDR